MTDFLDEKRREITTRLSELRPLVEEYNRLAAAAAALDEIRGPSAASAAVRVPAAAPAKKRGRSPGRKKVGPKTKKIGRPPTFVAGKVAAASAAAATGRRRAGRRKGSGTRAAQALVFVQGQPGITTPELASKMGIKQNYLYRVLPALEQEDKINRQGRGWHPAGVVAPRKVWCPICKKWVSPGKHKHVK